MIVPSHRFLSNSTNFFLSRNTTNISSDYNFMFVSHMRACSSSMTRLMCGLRPSAPHFFSSTTDFSLTGSSVSRSSSTIIPM